MAEVGRDLWRSFCPAALLWQAHLEWAARGHIQTFFNLCKDEGDSIKFLGNINPCSVSLTVEKRVSWCSDEISHISVYAHDLLACRHWKESGYAFLYLQVFIHINKYIKLFNIYRSTKAFPLLGCMILALSAFPWMSNVPVHYFTWLWPLGGSSNSRSGKPRTGHYSRCSLTCVRREEESPLLTCRQDSSQCIPGWHFSQEHTSESRWDQCRLVCSFMVICPTPFPLLSVKSTTGLIYLHTLTLLL